MARDQNEKLISVAALHLDSENPRHDSIDNEPEIIAALYRKGVPKLAAHIAQNGLSPLERLAVMAHERVKSRFVALEGNRRVRMLYVRNVRRQRHFVCNESPLSDSNVCAEKPAKSGYMVAT